MARPVMDLVGHTYGMLTVLARANPSDPYAMWLCRCECGGTKLARTKNLRNGDTRSCGCIGLGKPHHMAPSNRRPRYIKDAPPVPVALPCHTCARWLPLDGADLGGYCESGMFLIAKPHLGSCSYKTAAVTYDEADDGEAVE